MISKASRAKLPHRIALSDIVVEFPRPGRYNFTLLADGDALAKHILVAHLVSPA